MSETLAKVIRLVRDAKVRVSAHGYAEIAEDDIPVHNIIQGVNDAVVIEDYPTYSKGPCVLVLQVDSLGKPLHVVWGIPMGKEERTSRACNRVSTGHAPMVPRLHAEKLMSTRKRSKFVHEGRYVAEVTIELIESDEGWSPLLSLEDAYKLDDVRDALRREDLAAASKLGKIYELTPISP